MNWISQSFHLLHLTEMVQLWKEKPWIQQRMRSGGSACTCCSGHHATCPEAMNSLRHQFLHWRLQKEPWRDCNVWLILTLEQRFLTDHSGSQKWCKTSDGSCFAQSIRQVWRWCSKRLMRSRMTIETTLQLNFSSAPQCPTELPKWHSLQVPVKKSFVLGPINMYLHMTKNFIWQKILYGNNLHNRNN